MTPRAFRRSSARLWRFGVAILVPLLGALGVLLALLLRTASIAVLARLPVGLVVLGGVGLLALPLLGAWTVAHAVATRGAPDIIIDDIGIHDTRLPTTIEWANIRNVRLHATFFGTHMRVEVHDIEPVLGEMPRLLRAGFEGRGPEIDLQLSFFDAPEEIVRAAKSSSG